jgi:hypothetical protein
MAKQPGMGLWVFSLFSFCLSLVFLVSPLQGQEAVTQQLALASQPSTETIASFETALTKLQTLWSEQTARHEMLRQNATGQLRQTTSLENISKQQILADESLNASLGAIGTSLMTVAEQTQAAQSYLQNVSDTLSSSEATLKILTKQVKKLELTNSLLKWLAIIVGGFSLVEGGVLTGHYLLSWW